MTNNKDDKDDIFDFASAEWPDDDDQVEENDRPDGGPEGKDGSDAFKSASDSSGDFDSDPFSSLSDDDDPFGSGGDDGFSDAFSLGDKENDDDDDDPFSNVASDDDGFDDAFGVQDMPTPGQPVAASKSEAAGNPDDEFSDFGSSSSFDDAFGEDDDPSSATDVDDENSNDDVFGEEPSSENAGGGSEFEDVFSADSDDETDSDASIENESAPAAGSKSLVSKLMYPAIAALLLGGVYVGYSVVLPMLSGPGEVAPVATAPAPPPSFPSALPGQDGGLDIASAQPPQVPTAISGSGDHMEAPTLPASPSLPSSGPGISLPDLPVPSSPKEVTGIDEDLFAGGRSGGIDAMEPSAGNELPTLPQAATPVAEVKADGVSKDAFSEVISRLDRIETKIVSLEKRVDEFEDHRPSMAPMVPAATRPAPGVNSAEISSSEVSLADLLPPLKPLVVETASLKGVSRDIAWISTPSGVVEVKVGDTIPDGGRVENVVEYDGNWIVVTSKGIVVR